MRVTDLAAVQELVDVFFSHGQVGIDTARFYAEGTSEEVRTSLVMLVLSLI